MQFRVARCLGRRSVTLLVAFAFVAQSLVAEGTVSVSLAAATAVQRPVDSVLTPAQANPDLPLQGAAAALDATSPAIGGGVPVDPSVERGDIRPPQPEPAGTIVDARTDSHTRTVSKGDGTYVATTSPDEINYRDPAGHWRAIDLSLVPAAANSGFASRTKANDRVVELAGTAGPDLARLSGGSDSLRFGSPDVVGGSAARTSGGGLRYGSGPGPIVELTPTADGLSFTATFSDPKAPLAVSFTLDAAGLSPRLADDGSVALRDATGRTPFAIDAPVIVDAAGTRVTDVAVSLGRTPRSGVDAPGVITLTYRLAPKDAAALVYPLVLDPTLVLWPTNTTQTIKLVDGLSGSGISGAVITSITNGTPDGGNCPTTAGTTRTLANGTCQIDGVNPDLALTVALSGVTNGGAYFAKTFTLTPVPGTTISVSLWSTTTSQTLKLVDGATGDPVSGVAVYTSGYGTPSPFGSTTGPGGDCGTGYKGGATTDAGGLVTGSGVNPDMALNLCLVMSGYFSKLTTLTATPGTLQNLTLWTGQTQTIKLVDGTTGNPVANMQGSWTGSSNGTIAYACRTASTTADGLCPISGVNPDKPLGLTFTPVSGSYFAKSFTLTATPGTLQNLTLWTGQTQTIKLVDGTTGNPVANMQGSWTGSSNGTIAYACRTAGTAADGLCPISGVNPDQPLGLTFSGTPYFTKAVTLNPATGTIVITLFGGSGGDARNAAVGLSSTGTYYPNSSLTLGLGGVATYSRAYLTFAPPALPDGGQISKVTLGLYKATSGTDPLDVLPVTTSWDPAAITWATQPAVGAALSTISPPSGAGTAVTADVTSWARTAYTRNLRTNQPQWGFSLRSTREGQSGSSGWSIAGNGATTASQRPTLTLEYAIVAATIAFAPALGADFKPSTMVAGHTTNLPLLVTNTSWYTWNTAGANKVSVGYRWLDGDGALLAVPGFTPSGAVDLPGTTVGPNASVSVNLPVAAAPVPGNAKLRIDLLAVRDGSVLYFSDSALPALYWASAKPAGADSGYANYVGLSVVAKAEYQVDVTEDVSVLPVGTPLAEGGSTSIDAFSGNLTYAANDLTVADRGLDLSIGRTYNSATTATCDGILGACGWSTNADERITQPFSANPIYQDSQGHRHAGLVDHVGQITWAGAAGVDLTHRRVTLLDEVSRSGWTGTPPSIVTAPVASGTYAYQLPDAATASLPGLAVRLGAYPLVSWQTRTTSANSSAVVYTVTDKAGRSDTIAYVHGTLFATNATTVINDTTGSTVGAFLASSHNVYADALAGDTLLGRDLTLSAISLRVPAGSGATTFDGMVMLPSATTYLGDTFAGSGGTLETSDVYAGTSALNVTSTATVSPVSINLSADPFLTWAWKKGAGTNVAISVSVTDTQSNETHTLEYFAGAYSYPLINGEAPIPVSESLPAGWTQVTRNVLDDARAAFRAQPDPIKTRSGINPRTSGPHGNFFTINSIVLQSIDGQASLFDSLALGSAPSVASGDTAHEWALVRGDGTTAYFGEGGRLASLVDPSGNTQTYTWTYTPTTDAWRLDRISEGYAASRALTFAYPSGGVTSVTDVAGRSVTYTVSGSDLVAAQSFRGATSAYLYDAAHRLSAIRDPRYTTSNDNQATVAYDAAGLATTIYAGAAAANVPLAKVLNRTSGLVGGLTGIQVQTAVQLAAGTSAVTEFDPNGAIVNEYAPKAGTGLPSSADLRVTYVNDGLSQGATTIRYRTAGQADPLTERRGSNAEATLNAFRRATDAARINWTQSPAEYNASTDGPKLAYRTLAGYDANNDLVARTDAAGHTYSAAYDAARRLVYADDNFVANRGFSTDLASWSATNGPAWSNSAGNGSGFWNGGATLGASATLSQTLTLLPGTTFGLQADGRNGISLALAYHKASGWTSLGTLGPIGTSAYATAAASFWVPLDSDTGQVRLTISGAAGGAVDNVLLRTAAEARTYDAYGNPATSTDLLGRVRHTFYEADPGGAFAAGVYPTRSVANEVAGGTGPDQNVTQAVTRNATGSVLTSSDPLGRTTTIVYAAGGVDATSVSDPAGDTTTFTYDVEGRVATSVSPNGNVTGANPPDYRTTNTYDGFGRLADLADPAGGVTHTAYDVAGHPTADFGNFTDGVTLAGLTNVKTVTAYDADGRTTSSVVDAGTGNLGLTSALTYDLQGNTLSETDPAGRVTTTWYDAAGRAAGIRAPIAATGAPAPLCPGSATLYCSSVTAFDILGRPISATDAFGHTTLTRYDVNGQPVALTDARGNTTAARYDLGGRTVASTDQLGGVTTTAYDALDRPTLVTRADTTFAKAVYDAAGELTDAAAPAAPGTPDAALIWSHTTYDPAGRAVTTTAHYVAGGASAADQNVVTSTTTYDAEGHILLTTGAPGSVGGAGLVTKSTYDALGRRTSVITNYVAGVPPDDATNMTTAIAYDALGRPVTETDPAGVVTKSTYDRAGRLTSVIANSIPGSPSSATVNVTSGYAYNAAGELTGYCPPVAGLAGGCATGAWSYGRDGLGNVSSQSAPAGTTLGGISATYDAAGRLAASFDGLHTQTYTYDAANNVAGISATGGGAPAVTYTYTYDAANRRASASNGSDTLAFEYDALSRLTAVKRAGATISGATYNPDGTLATSVQPAGTASFTYDGLARLATASMPALFTGVATFTWRPDGLLGARTWPAGTSESFAYDAARRPATLTLRKADTSVLATFTSAFDRVGNLVSEAQVLTGKSGIAGNSTISLTADPLRRVTGYTVTTGGIPTSVAYTYDADSNRLSAGATTFAYNGADELVSQTKGGVVRGATYDAAGNLLSSPVSDPTNSTFTYDAANKPLTEAVPGLPLVTYTYDALDRRASRTAGTATEAYAYVGTGTTIGRIDRGGGSVTDSAIDALGDRLTVGGTFIVPNVRGDVAALLDPTQTSISDAYRYDPFGVTLASLGTSLNPYRFQGRLLESTSGQYDFGSRQYDPALAAFTSLDTTLGNAANPISLNRFLYALADPESMIDPDGHSSCRYLDGCEEIAAATKLDGLRAAATAADLAATLALVAALGADTVAAAAQAAANQPCLFSDKADCPSWKHSLAAAAAAARRTATTAWANYHTARKRATAAHQALTRAIAAQAAIKKRNSQPKPKPKTTSPYGITSPGKTLQTCGMAGTATCPSDKGTKLDPLVPVAAVAVVVATAGCLASGLCEAIGGAVAAACGIFCDKLRSAGDAAKEVVDEWGPAKPEVSSQTLKVLIDQLYRPGAAIGNGGTGDAIRAGVGHIQKGGDYIVATSRWIATNPNAATSDIQAAQAVLTDLISAMAGQPYPGR